MLRISALLLGAFTCTSLAQDGSLYQRPLHIESYLRHLVLTDDLIEFHKNLTQIESITYNEGKAGKWLAQSLVSQGYTVKEQYVDRKADRFNVFAYPGETGQTKVLVSSHIDTVRLIQLNYEDSLLLRYGGRSRHFILTSARTGQYMEGAA